MANNIKFYYMYRDAGNSKNHRDIVFENTDAIDLEEVEALIISKLIDETFFYVEEWMLPDLHFGTWDNRVDVTWHEFAGLAYTDDAGNSETPIGDFLAAVRAVKL